VPAVLVLKNCSVDRLVIVNVGLFPKVALIPLPVITLSSPVSDSMVYPGALKLRVPTVEVVFEFVINVGVEGPNVAVPVGPGIPGFQLAGSFQSEETPLPTHVASWAKANP
jgi:hypothetical protein